MTIPLKCAIPLKYETFQFRAPKTWPLVWTGTCIGNKIKKLVTPMGYLFPRWLAFGATALHCDNSKVQSRRYAGGDHTCGVTNLAWWGKKHWVGPSIPHKQGNAWNTTKYNTFFATYVLNDDIRWVQQVALTMRKPLKKIAIVIFFHLQNISE